jgi:hypothetical protein
VVLFLAAVIGQALAGTTYEVDLAIVGEPPEDFATIDPRWLAGSLFVARGVPDLEAPADWPYLRCAVRDERVTVRFLATAEDWPATFPDRAICRSGGFTLVMRLVPRAGAWAPPTAAPTVATEAVVRAPFVDGHPTVAAGTFLLPVDSYVAGTYEAVLQPPADGEPAPVWEGVYCRVVPDRRAPSLLVIVSDEAAPGGGACALPRPRQDPLVMPVFVER